jgi:hypothetical protein
MDLWARKAGFSLFFKIISLFAGKNSLFDRRGNSPQIG